MQNTLPNSKIARLPMIVCRDKFGHVNTKAFRVDLITRPTKTLKVLGLKTNNAKKKIKMLNVSIVQYT
jgi:hypothetical protein